MAADRIGRILQTRAPGFLSGDYTKPAAVLVPIQEREDGEHLVLTLRTELLNSHRGQVAFPGGQIDPRDAGPLAAALRESEEEIGLAPADVRVLGQLDQVTAAANYLVTPFVGFIPHPYEFRLNELETAAVFSVPPAEGDRASPFVAGRVKSRQTLLARRFEQLADAMDSFPSFLAATVAEALDRFENRLRFVADEIIIHVDHQHRRPLAEPRPLAITRFCKDLFISLRQYIVPCRHSAVPLFQ